MHDLNIVRTHFFSNICILWINCASRAQEPTQFKRSFEITKINVLNRLTLLKYSGREYFIVLDLDSVILSIEISLFSKLNKTIQTKSSLFINNFK